MSAQGNTILVNVKTALISHISLEFFWQCSFKRCHVNPSIEVQYYYATHKIHSNTVILVFIRNQKCDKQSVLMQTK